MTASLRALHAAIAKSWRPDTCAPEDLPRWSERNPARGQCGTTALVVHDHLGGQLVRGEVHVDGQRVDYHWWNLLPSGEEIDFTRVQFDETETVVGHLVVDRPSTPGRLDARYQILLDRVSGELDREARGCL